MKIKYNKRKIRCTHRKL